MILSICFLLTSSVAGEPVSIVHYDVSYYNTIGSLVAYTGRNSRTSVIDRTAADSVGIHSDKGIINTCMVGSAIPCWQLLLFILTPVVLLVMTCFVQLIYYTGCFCRQAKTFSPSNYPVISESLSVPVEEEETENSQQKKPKYNRVTEVLCCGYWRRGVVSGIVSFLAVVVIIFAAGTPFATLQQEFAGDRFTNAAGDETSIDVKVTREIGIFQSCSRIQNIAIVRAGQSNGEVLDDNTNVYCRSTSDICEGFNTILLMARILMASAALCLFSSLIFSFLNSVGKMPSWTGSLHQIVANIQIAIIICLQFILHHNPFCNHDELVDSTNNSTLNGSFVRRSFSTMGYKTSSSVFCLMLVWVLTVYILIATSNHAYRWIYLRSESENGVEDDFYLSRFFKRQERSKDCLTALIGFLVIPPGPHDRTHYFHFVSSAAFVAHLQQKQKSGPTPSHISQHPQPIQQQQRSPAVSDADGNLFVVRSETGANSNTKKIVPLRQRVQQLLQKNDELEFDSDDDGHREPVARNQEPRYRKNSHGDYGHQHNPLRGPNFF